MLIIIKQWFSDRAIWNMRLYCCQRWDSIKESQPLCHHQWEHYVFRHSWIPAIKLPQLIFTIASEICTLILYLLGICDNKKEEVYVVSLGIQQTPVKYMHIPPHAFFYTIIYTTPTAASTTNMKMKWAFGNATCWQLFLYTVVGAIVETQQLLTFD